MKRFLNVFFAFLLLVPVSVISVDVANRLDVLFDQFRFDGRNNSLTLCKLCSEKVKANELCADHAVIDKAYIDELKVEVQEVDFLTVKNQLCVNNVRAPNICVDGLLTTSQLCVSDGFEQCQKFRAYVAMAANQVGYSLGNIVSFDTVVDDPNGNILQAPTRYIVPRSGYYVVTLQLDELSLRSALGEVIAGIPVAKPIIEVNGVSVAEQYVPFLSFSTTQKTHFSGVLRLLAGDVITIRYNILVLDQVTGLQNFVGLADFLGNPLFTASKFVIHYLSSDCGDVCQPCPTTQPCPPVRVSDVCAVECGGCGPCI